VSKTVIGLMQRK